MADPAHACGRSPGKKSGQGTAEQHQRDQAQQDGERPPFEKADQQQVAEEAIHHAREAMGADGPEEPHRDLHQDDRDPNGDIGPGVPRQHQVTEGKKHQAVGEQMPKAPMAEGGRDQRPPGRPRAHGQVPATGEHQLIDQLLEPGDAEEDQRKRDHCTRNVTPITAVMSLSIVRVS